MNLFDSLPHNGTATSVAAADMKQDRGTAQLDRLRVLAFIRERGERGATDEEMQIGIPLAGNTQRPRRWELAMDGTIYKDGTRSTTSGGKAAIWKLTKGN